MNRQNLRLFAKYAIYVAVIFFAYILQSTPGLFEFCGVKPLLVLPACICAAVYEGEYAGGLLAVFGGLLCDFASDTIFGFNAILFLVLCCATGLAFMYLVRAAFANVMFVSLGALFVRALLVFAFSYAIWGYGGLASLFYTYTAPSVVWSAAFTPIFFFIARGVHSAFEPADEKEAGI